MADASRDAERAGGRRESQRGDFLVLLQADVNLHESQSGFSSVRLPSSVGDACCV